MELLISIAIISLLWLLVIYWDKKRNNDLCKNQPRYPVARKERRRYDNCGAAGNKGPAEHHQ